VSRATAALKGCATAIVTVTAISVAQAFRPAQETRPSFTDFLASIRAEALSRGVSQATVDAALSNIEEPVPVVIERDRAQAEIVQSFERYIAHHVSAKTIKTGREMLDRHRVLVDEVGRAYGVPPGIILSIWGMESNYGRFSGVRPTIAALATLAWDPRRSTFFRGELFDALAIVDRGDIDLAELRGSWAGAMGQVQFMPSSYLAYAEDFDGDGRRDIWSTTADVFASIANYLVGHGWHEGETWGREVVVSAAAERHVRADVARRNGSCQATRDMTVALPMTKWQELGVRLAKDRPLPKTNLDASLVSGAKRHFLVYQNYDALLEYNCAHSYALSVGLLADRIGVQSKGGR
jgi:membrane-bound lytic murein transglycosylase B